MCAAYIFLLDISTLTFNFNFNLWLWSMGEKDTLLPSDANNFIPYQRIPDHHGVYMQYDTKRKVWPVIFCTTVYVGIPTDLHLDHKNANSSRTILRWFFTV